MPYDSKEIVIMTCDRCSNCHVHYICRYNVRNIIAKHGDKFKMFLTNFGPKNYIIKSPCGYVMSFFVHMHIFVLQCSQEIHSLSTTWARDNPRLRLYLSSIHVRSLSPICLWLIRFLRVVLE